MIRAALPACLVLATAAAPLPLTAQQRIPIDLGPDAPTAASPPQRIDLALPVPPPEPAGSAVRKECEDRREAGVVAGEIVVCRELESDPAQFYSGSREAWFKAYAERTQRANSIPAPDVAGSGIFQGPATLAGLCVIPPCPRQAVMIDVTAIPPPPAGSDAERVAQGLEPLESDDAPLSAEERRRKEADLGLPPAAPLRP